MLVDASFLLFSVPLWAVGSGLCYDAVQVCVSQSTPSTNPFLSAKVCSRFVAAQPGDSCGSLVAKYKLTYAQFYALNPGIDCPTFPQTAAILGLQVRPLRKTRVVGGGVLGE